MTPLDSKGLESAVSPLLWNIFEHTGSLKICQMAMNATEPTAPFANNTRTHGIGNVIMPGFGNGYRLLKLVKYLTIIKNSCSFIIYTVFINCSMYKIMEYWPRIFSCY